MLVNHLAAIRNDSGLKAKHVAAFMGVSVQTMSTWESRKPHRQTYPSIKQLHALMSMYKEIGVELTLDDFYSV